MSSQNGLTPFDLKEVGRKVKGEESIMSSQNGLTPFGLKEVGRRVKGEESSLRASWEPHGLFWGALGGLLEASRAPCWPLKLSWDRFWCSWKPPGSYVDALPNDFELHNLPFRASIIYLRLLLLLIPTLLFLLDLIILLLALIVLTLLACVW